MISVRCNSTAMEKSNSMACDSYLRFFKYLGSLIDYTLNDDVDVENRRKKAMNIFYAHSGVFQNKDISVEIRMSFYKAQVINTLLWGCESWALTAKQTRRLEATHTTLLRHLLGYSKLKKIPNEETYERANCTTLKNMMELRRSRFLFKMAQMPAGPHSPKYVRKVVGAWVFSDDENGRSNRRVERPYQTIRHGIVRTLRYLGYKGDDSNLFKAWMTDARDLNKWSNVVETKLELPAGSFLSLYRSR